MKTISTNDLPISIPKSVAVCPKCESGLILEDIEGYEYGEPLDEHSHIAFTCNTEPDIDSDEWEDWHNWHWSMPYVDWLPLEKPIMRWFNENYRMGEDVSEKLRLWNGE
jgi:hypothetical protein